VVTVFEMKKLLKDLGVSKYDIHQALRIADAKKKLIKKERNANKNECFSVKQATHLLVLQFQQ
jgi:hypothetical protein